LASPLTLVISAVTLLGIGRASWSIYDKAAAGAERLARAEAGAEKLAADRAELLAKTAELSTDAGIEAALREKYRAVRPGESVAAIVADAPKTSAAGGAESSSTPPAPAGGLWPSILRLFGL